MTDGDKALYEAWDRTYEQVQFWVGVHEKALLIAHGNTDDPAVRFARIKRDEAEAEHHDVVKRLAPSESKQHPGCTDYKTLSVDDTRGLISITQKPHSAVKQREVPSTPF